MTRYRNPVPTADIVIELDHAPGRIVMIERGHAPHGWALPGGFVDYGECVEDAARREAEEETGLDVELVTLLGVYSRPDRDPRLHTMSSVFVARSNGVPRGSDDAARAEIVDPASPPQPVVFDHAEMLADYLRWRAEDTARAPAPGRWLGIADRRKLVTIARDTIEATALGRAPPMVEQAGLGGRFAQLAGCFVTVHVRGELRGCIGNVVPDRPLAVLVRDMAIAACTRDPRFAPLRPDELAEMTLDVSVLAPARRATPDEIVLGKHGLVLSADGKRGLLLPQVAREHGLDRDQFLDAVARKAGLPPDGWRRPDAVLEIFTAQVF